MRVGEVWGRGGWGCSGGGGGGGGAAASCFSDFPFVFASLSPLAELVALLRPFFRQSRTRERKVDGFRCGGCVGNIVDCGAVVEMPRGPLTFSPLPLSADDDDDDVRADAADELR